MFERRADALRLETLRGMPELVHARFGDGGAASASPDPEQTPATERLAAELPWLGGRGP